MPDASTSLEKNEKAQTQSSMEKKADVGENDDNCGPMRHLVLFNLPKDSEKDISSEFRQLKDKISNIVNFEAGMMKQPLMKAQQGKLSHAFLVTFTNKAARNKYLPHPEHKKCV
eukprot:jgi/Bigna1/83953/fgenesh1_pg.119_\